MALARKPHTLTFTPITETRNASGVVQIPTEGEAQTVAGQLTPEKFTTAYERTGMELRRPHLFMFDTADESKVQPGYKAVVGSREFEVMEAPQVWNAIAANSCCSVILEEKEFG